MKRLFFSLLVACALMATAYARTSCQGSTPDPTMPERDDAPRSEEGP